MSDLIPTPLTDSAMQAMIDGSGLPAPALVKATRGLMKVAQQSERENVLMERALKFFLFHGNDHCATAYETLEIIDQMRKGRG